MTTRRQYIEETSLAARADASLAGAGDASPAAANDVAGPQQRHCGWCETLLTPERPRWCSKRCRQAAWRARQIAIVEGADGGPKVLKYADPPYPGKSRRYYGGHPDFAGEVDHAALIASLEYSSDGWALSTSAESLPLVLPLCPEGVRIGAWVKPNGAAPLTRGPHNLWEPVIYKPARRRRPGVRDWISAKPARGGHDRLIGRKPIPVCMWIFRLLGAAPDDRLGDLFPGSGNVSAAWRQFCATSPRYRCDVAMSPAVRPR